MCLMTITWYVSIRVRLCLPQRKPARIGLERPLVRLAGRTTTEWALLVVDAA